MFAFLTRFDAKNTRNLNQNPDQSCCPIIGLRALLKRKLIKDFKKVGPILGNPFYNSQYLLFWRDLTQKMPEFFCKNQNPDQSCRPTRGLRAVLKRKLIKDFKKVGPILGNPSYNSQCLLFWCDLTQKMPKIVPFDKKKFCQIDVKIVVQPNDPSESSVQGVPA